MRKDTDKCKLIEGELTADGLRFAIIVSRFNSFITERLLGGAVDALGTDGRVRRLHQSRQGARLTGKSPWSPMSWGKTATSTRSSALGAVIRGETPHFDYVASESAKGVASASLATGVPTIYGILTCNTLEQAIDRAGAKGGNKGFDAALTAIEMANLLKDLRQNGKAGK